MTARIAVAFGTRPEAIKMASVVYAIRDMDGMEPLLLLTGQHREQLDAALRIFDLKGDTDLAVMTDRQSLPELTARIVPAAAERLRELKPDYLLVHGDTLTTFAVSLAAFFEGVPVAHVEAGLRSFDLAEPFPEEANRRLTDVLTDLDLPPTELARKNLLAEGKSVEEMVVTGNTVVDAVRLALPKARLPEHLSGRRLVTVTMHRRENLPVLRELAQELAGAAREFPELTFVYPMHLNPAVRERVVPALSGIDNVMLEEPYDYLRMLALLDASELAITDSGGIQEEGTAVGVPVAVLRNVTERPEGVQAGSLVLAGNEPERAGRVIRELLGDEVRRLSMRTIENPYGDGHAGQRVAKAVAWRLGLSSKPEDWRRANSAPALT